MSGAVSDRKLHSFIRIRFPLLSHAFPSKMRKAPSYSRMRELLVELNKDDLEAAFRQHAGALFDLDADYAIAGDGKTMRHSFDAMDDRNAAQILSLFVAGERIILAHRDIDEKSNEIPAMQALIGELSLEGKLYTADAEHCQKKTFEQAQACGSQILAQVRTISRRSPTHSRRCRRRRRRLTCRRRMMTSRMAGRRTVGSRSTWRARHLVCQSGRPTR